MIKSLIRKRMNNYHEVLHEPDLTLPQRLTEERSVAVVGAGIAGMVSAYYLAKRGFNVTLYEANDYLGGKLGSWTFDSNGEILRTEHGFHAFFRQYLNLRRFMDELDLTKYLIPISDYSIQTSATDFMHFGNVATTPMLNIFDLGRKGVYRFRDFIFNPKRDELNDFFKYEAEYIIERYDHMTFDEFARDYHISANLQFVFTTFSRAFFSDPDKISMAALLKGFHFYFLASDHGLVYDVLRDDFHDTFLMPVKNALVELGVDIRMNAPVNRITSDDGYQIGDQHFDYLILATDMAATKRIVDQSPDLSALKSATESMPESGLYAVWRVWTDREFKTELPFFVFTDRTELLDSVTFYDHMEDQSRQWAETHNGGIYEFHSYALPERYATDPEGLKSAFLHEFYHFYPQLNPIAIKHDYLQIRRDFTSYAKGYEAHRPGVETNQQNVFFAGDWVRTETPSLLMEGATTSALYAVNAISKRESIQTERIESVPTKGIMV